MHTLSQPAIILLSSLALITGFSCESAKKQTQDIDDDLNFSERFEYQREAKVLSAEHQVYPKDICVEASESISGEGFCFSNGMLGNVPQGELFLDHGDCDDVRTMGTNGHLPITKPDPAERYSDPSYVQEVDWLRSQIRSSGCICCHDAESGYATTFDVSLGSNWVGTISDRGIALAAGLVGKGVFVTVPAESNHNFAASGNVFVSTDPERMQAFFEREVEYRGLTDEDIELASRYYSFVPFADLVDEIPEPCPEGVGVDRENKLHWTLDGVRFINILQDNDLNPNIPPLDSPAGTLWRFEATSNAEAFTSGTLDYKAVSNDQQAQRYPRDGSQAETLVEGETYTLFVTSRMSGASRQHCTFTYPVDSP